MSEVGFNWVGARAECSLLPVFHRLQADCDTDVGTMNERLRASELRGQKAHFALESNEANTQFWVFGNINPRLIVKFIFCNDRIEVATPSKTLSVTLTLNNEGKCKLRVDGAQELDQWQLRKLVLEELFFGR
jgi:hypothetical protein